MPREPFWTPYERHRDLIDRLDAEADAVHEETTRVEFERCFSKEMDCV